MSIDTPKLSFGANTNQSENFCIFSINVIKTDNISLDMI